MYDFLKHRLAKTNHTTPPKTIPKPMAERLLEEDSSFLSHAFEWSSRESREEKFVLTGVSFLRAPLQSDPNDDPGSHFPYIKRKKYPLPLNYYPVLSQVDATIKRLPQVHSCVPHDFRLWTLLPLA